MTYCRRHGGTFEPNCRACVSIVHDRAPAPRCDICGGRVEGHDSRFHNPVADSRSLALDMAEKALASSAKWWRKAEDWDSKSDPPDHEGVEVHGELAVEAENALAAIRALPGRGGK